MRSKTLKFDDEVLSVLKAMTWEQGGRLGKLNSQLDRNLYVRTNKALEAMGGAWNRKLGMHSFVEDPRPQVEGLLETGALQVDDLGWFWTPEAVTQRMIELVGLKPWMSVLEPSAGEGHMLDVLKAYQPGAEFVAVEIHPGRAETLRKKGYLTICVDFLELVVPSREFGFDRVFMNPPFEDGQDMDHVRRAYEHLKPGGVLVSVMSPGAFFREDRKANAFRDWLKTPASVKLEILPDGSFKESGTGVSTRLIVIRKGKE
jgi:SAM-dependent methyltransferase